MRLGLLFASSLLVFLGIFLLAQSIIPFIGAVLILGGLLGVIIAAIFPQ